MITTAANIYFYLIHVAILGMIGDVLRASHRHLSRYQQSIGKYSKHWNTYKSICYLIIICKKEKKCIHRLLGF